MGYCALLTRLFPKGPVFLPWIAYTCVVAKVGSRAIGERGLPSFVRFTGITQGLKISMLGVT